MPPSRRLLEWQARIMRFLMRIGLAIHALWPLPRSPKLSFTRRITSTLSSQPGHISVSIYTPASYATARRHGFRSVRSGAGYPCIINFHGGGFTLGQATDDARFCRAAIGKLECVVVSVDYRLAPEHPFPTAVDDGADAVLWVVEHAAELGIDPDCLAISGFSSGGNLTLTVPVRLADLTTKHVRPTHMTATKTDTMPSDSGAATTGSSTSKSTAQLRVQPLGAASSNISLAPLLASSSKDESDPPTRRAIPGPFRIRALAPFYPSTDYTLSRATRRCTNPSPQHDLGPFLTRLFDGSYLGLVGSDPGVLLGSSAESKPSTALTAQNSSSSSSLDPPLSQLDVDVTSAYISPCTLSAPELRSVYASMRVIGVGCEYDMLCDEGGRFMRRLRAARRGLEGDALDATEEVGQGEAGLGEDVGVTWGVVRGVPHGWDKRPFLSGLEMTGVLKEYAFVCERLAEAFELPRHEGTGD